jgi:hypothetical protein
MLGFRPRMRKREHGEIAYERDVELFIPEDFRHIVGPAVVVAADQLCLDVCHSCTSRLPTT